MRSIVIVLIGLLGCAVAQEMIRQCMCNEVEKCKEQVKAAMPQCAEGCKTKLAAIGKPDAIKQCVEGKQAKFMQMKECVMSKLGPVCANEPNKMIPKEDLHAMKEEAEQEAQSRFANSPLASSPMFQGMVQVMGTMKEFGHCVKDCVRDKTNQCFAQLGCGIDVPPKEEMQEAVKQCAGQKDPAEMQATCQCFVNNGGVTQLASICPLIGNFAGMGGMGGGMGGNGLLARLRG